MKKIILVLTVVGFLVGCGGGSKATVVDSDQDTISDGQDNCPLMRNTDQLDTDNDGKGNVCDLDDDNDGFLDADDPEPLNVQVPGDFSTPEAIINHSLVKEAINQAKITHHKIETHLEKSPPNLTGYYRVESAHGEFVLTSNNEEIGRRLVGSENRITLKDGHLVDQAKISFAGTMSVSYKFSDGSIIRGKDNSFTIYTRGKNVCTESDSNYTMYMIGIHTATLDTQNGNIIASRELSVNIGTKGKLTQACIDRYTAENEDKGGWSIFTYDLMEKIEDVTTLQYMCVDEDRAYIPTETWLNTGGNSCSCTKIEDSSEYEVTCTKS